MQRPLLALLALAAGGASSYPAPLLAAPKTDVVVLQNGDRLTGEVQELDRGRLSLSTDAAKTIGIEWDLVTSLVSRQRMRIETRDGQVLVGSLGTPQRAGELLVLDAERSLAVPLLDVVRMAPIESALLKRFTGDFSAGYSLLAANSQSQFNFALNSQYRTPRYLSKFAASISSTSNSDGPASRRDSGTFEPYYLFGNRWFAGALVQADRNDELGIRERVSVGAGIGRFLVQTNSRVWEVLVGIASTHEQDVDSPEKSRSAEAILTTSFDWFRYAKPEWDLSTSLSLLPNLSESGRWRATGSLSLKWQIYADLFWQVRFTGDYDDRPRAGGASHVDYSLFTSLGARF